MQPLQEELPMVQVRVAPFLVNVDILTRVGFRVATGSSRAIDVTMRELIMPLSMQTG